MCTHIIHALHKHTNARAHVCGCTRDKRYIRTRDTNQHTHAEESGLTNLFSQQHKHKHATSHTSATCTTSPPLYPRPRVESTFSTHFVVVVVVAFAKLNGVTASEACSRGYECTLLLGFTRFRASHRRAHDGLLMGAQTMQCTVSDRTDCKTPPGFLDFHWSQCNFHARKARTTHVRRILCCCCCCPVVYTIFIRSPGIQQQRTNLPAQFGLSIYADGEREMPMQTVRHRCARTSKCMIDKQHSRQHSGRD